MPASTMPHGRIAVRVPETLGPLLAARVGHGRTASDSIREALELSLGVRQTERPAPPSSPSALPSETPQASAAVRQELAETRLDDVAQVLFAARDLSRQGRHHKAREAWQSWHAKDEAR